MKLRERKVLKNSNVIKKESIKKNYDNLIEKNYEKIENPGSFGGIKRIFNELKIKNKNIKENDIKKYLSNQDEYTLHKPIKRKFSRNKVVVTGIDDTWQMDLVDMSMFQKENNKITFILTIIDVFSKYAWGRMILNKKGETVKDAIKSVIESSNRKPNKIHTDQGTEFFNIQCKSYFDKNNIKHYFTKSALKASIIERFNRTLKDRMWRYFTSINSRIYYDQFDKFFKSYNSSLHSSIKMKPSNVNKKNEGQVFMNLYGFEKNKGEIKTDVKILFKKGDFVRVSKYKHIFSKGYERNWTNEVFEVHKVLLNHSFPVYILIDLMGEEITGSFYAEEIQKVSINIRALEDSGEFFVDQVLETRTVKSKKEYLVSWKYYPESTNSWIKEENWRKK